MIETEKPTSSDNLNGSKQKIQFLQPENEQESM